MNNTQFVIVFAIAAALALMSVGVILYQRRTVADPVEIAKREAYQRAAAAVKAQGDGPESLLRAIRLDRFWLYSDTWENDGIAARLKQLDELHKNGEIADAIYIERYREILDAIALSSHPPSL